MGLTVNTLSNPALLFNKQAEAISNAGINQSNALTTSLASANASAFMLVTPQSIVGIQPQNIGSVGGPGLQNTDPAILFHYEGEQSVSMQADVTDHYSEKNEVLNDQIALRAVEITTHGYIGELNDVAPFGLQSAKYLASKMTIVAGLTPQASAAALLAYNQAQLAYSVTETVTKAAVSITQSINGGGEQPIINGNTIQNSFNGNANFSGFTSTQTKQQIVFAQFYGYFVTRRLFRVQTPWAIFENMTIKSFRAIQDPETRMISDFEITFKQLRFSNSDTQARQERALVEYQQRTSNQGSVVKEIGPYSPPVDVDIITKFQATAV